jgi:hypothetical protein
VRRCIILRRNQVAQIVVRVGIVRFEREGSFVMRHGLCDPALRGERYAQIVVAIGTIRLQEKGAFVSQHGVADPARSLMPQGIVKQHQS